MNITAKIRWLALGLVIATAVLIGAVVRWGFTSLIRDQQRENLQRQVEVEVVRLGSALDAVRHDVALFQQSPAVARYIRALTSGDDRATADQLLADVFRAFLAKRPLYRQMRLIGLEDGRELMRSERTGDTVRLVPTVELQDKSERPYVLAAARHPIGAVYYSRVNLNREHGIVQDPPDPMLRALSVVAAPDGRRFGLVVFNIDFDAFIQNLYAAESGRYRYFVTRADGGYLFHPDPDKTFGFDRDRPFGAPDEFPALAPYFEPAKPSTGALIETDDGWIAFEPAPVLAGSPDDPLHLGIAADFDDIETGGDAVVTRALAITLGLLIVALAAAVVLSSVIVRPLRRITAAAIDIARDAPPESLPTDRVDEIGTLARAFRQMVDTLQSHETELERINTELRRANEDLQHFAYIASHDLREPARRVAGLADVVLFEEADRVSDDGRMLLERMHAMAEHMLVQIADFRVLARIGHGSMVRHPTAIAQIVDEVLAEHTDAIGDRPVTVHKDPLPTLPIYDNLVRVLYRHLVANALQHAAPGPMDLSFTAEQTDDGWVLGVSNTGSHIAADRLDAIFKPFSRGADSDGGTGLGLSICRRIVERHAGIIRAASSGDQTRFTFTLGEPTDGAAA